MDNSIIYLIIRFSIGAFATLLAVILWTKTRDIAWLLVIIAVMLNYIGILYDVLDLFGFVNIRANVPVLDSIITIFFDNASTLCLAVTLIIMIRRRN